MTKASSGESRSTQRRVLILAAIAAGTLLAPALVEAASIHGGEGVDPAKVRAAYLAEWVTGGNRCLNQIFNPGSPGDPDSPSHPADFSYDPTTGIATIRAVIWKRNPVTGEDEPGLAPMQQQPDAYYKANNGVLLTALMRYDPNARPGARVEPADPATALYIYRICLEPRSQMQRWEIAPPPGTLPAPPPLGP